MVRAQERDAMQAGSGNLEEERGLMSVAGQRHDTVPPESRQGLAQGLFEMDLPKERAGTMIRKNPARLLGIP